MSFEKNSSFFKAISAIITVLFTINSVAWGAPVDVSALRGQAAGEEQRKNGPTLRAMAERFNQLRLKDELAKKAASDTVVLDATGAQIKDSDILTQEQLAGLFAAQDAGNWSAIQDAQQILRRSQIATYQKKWREFSAAHPAIKPVFDMSNPEAQEFTITPQAADMYMIMKSYKEFCKKAQNSTAGIRAFIDLLHSENPNMMYNDMFMAILIDAEAEFLKDVHEALNKTLEGVDPKAFAAKVREDMGGQNVKIVEEIYGMPLEALIPFLRDNIVKLVGGEVRVHTSKYVEMESRILAEKGVTVITTQNNTDSVPIYMFSFLSYILGACGATHYTSSHSANYLYGRKTLSPDGAQLLPEQYNTYLKILADIVEGKIYKQGSYTLRTARADSPRIKRTLTYDRITSLYRSILNITDADVAMINEAGKQGHSIIANCLNGSTWNTLKPLLQKLGINEGIIEPMLEKEDPYFNMGFVVTKDKKTGEYGIDHLGVDTTMTKIAKSIPYPVMLKGRFPGKRIYELDPDSDRFVLKQILEKTPENIALLKKYCIDYYELGDGKILIAPSPNKVFLSLDIADYERMLAAGTWQQFESLYMITYVSSRAWSEFGDAVQGLKRVMHRVGFKNFNEIERKVEEWYANKPDEYEFKFTDQLGRDITIDRSKKIRIHSKQEESGGRVAGMDKLCHNVLGQAVMAMPEKSAVDSLFAELILSSRLHLQDKQHYPFINMFDQVFSRYDLKSAVDVRIDILHGDQGRIALLSSEEQTKALARADALKRNFNNFFFSAARAARDKKITREQTVKIFSEVLPKYKDTWECLDLKEGITLAEERNTQGQLGPEGVPIVFSPQNGKTPLVVEFDFRPSGTDPLKSKLYADAIKLTDEQKKELEVYFNALCDYDLYQVLAHYGVASVYPAPAPADMAELGLKKLEIGKGPEAASKQASQAEVIDSLKNELKMGDFESARSILELLINKCIAAQGAWKSLKGVYDKAERREKVLKTEIGKAYIATTEAQATLLHAVEFIATFKEGRCATESFFADRETKEMLERYGIMDGLTLEKTDPAAMHDKIVAFFVRSASDTDTMTRRDFLKRTAAAAAGAAAMLKFGSTLAQQMPKQAMKPDPEKFAFVQPVPDQVIKPDPAKLTTFLTNNMTPTTADGKLFRSFYIPEDHAKSIYEEITKDSGSSRDAAIERRMMHQLNWYDHSCAQIFTLRHPDQASAEHAGSMVYSVARSSWGGFSPIKSTDTGYFPDGDKIGLLFRAIDANGIWMAPDPYTGTQMEWSDWKPIAGENAWVILSMMHFVKQGKADEKTKKKALEEAVDLADSLLAMQAENGGIRYAPKGTWHSDADTEKTWCWNEISTENNLSSYAAFRALHEITGDAKYLKAMQAIEKYLKTVTVVDEAKGLCYFAQGSHYDGKKWSQNLDNFATDCQTWAIDVLGPKKVDEIFGKPGAAFMVWKAAREKAGQFENDKSSRLLGLAFTEGEDTISVEWTCGGIMACLKLAFDPEYNDVRSQPQYAAEAKKALLDAQTMHLGTESLKVELFDEKKNLVAIAYPYASRRVHIPFGWNAPPRQVLSATSTAWEGFIKFGIDPFRLDGQILGTANLFTNVSLEKAAKQASQAEVIDSLKKDILRGDFGSAKVTLEFFISQYVSALGTWKHLNMIDSRQSKNIQQALDSEADDAYHIMTRRQTNLLRAMESIVKLKDNDSAGQRFLTTPKTKEILALYGIEFTATDPVTVNRELLAFFAKSASDTQGAMIDIILERFNSEERVVRAFAANAFYKLAQLGVITLNRLADKGVLGDFMIAATSRLSKEESNLVVDALAMVFESKEIRSNSFYAKDKIPVEHLLQTMVISPHYAENCAKLLVLVSKNGVIHHVDLMDAIPLKKLAEGLLLDSIYSEGFLKALKVFREANLLNDIAFKEIVFGSAADDTKSASEGVIKKYIEALQSDDETVQLNAATALEKIEEELISLGKAEPGKVDLLNDLIAKDLFRSLMGAMARVKAPAREMVLKALDKMIEQHKGTEPRELDLIDVFTAMVSVGAHGRALHSVEMLRHLVQGKVVSAEFVSKWLTQESSVAADSQSQSYIQILIQNTIIGSPEEISDSLDAFGLLGDPIIVGQEAVRLLDADDLEKALFGGTQPLGRSGSDTLLDIDKPETLNHANLLHDIIVSQGAKKQMLGDAARLKRIARSVKGGNTIVINPASYNLTAEEIKHYQKGSPALTALEEDVGCTIRLSTQLEAKDIRGSVIALSSTELTGELYSGAKYIDPAQSSLPLAEQVGVAKIMIGAENAQAIADALNDSNIFDQQVTAADVADFLAGRSAFRLPVPKVDFEGMEDKQRIALAALIAA